MSPRVPVHHHPCQDCGVKTECPGTWEENYDGEPDVICAEFHQLNQSRVFDRNPDFVCDECAEKRPLNDAEVEAIATSIADDINRGVNAWLKERSK